MNGPVGLANWKDYCYDLSGSGIYTQLTSDDYALKEGDTVYGIAYVIESWHHHQDPVGESRLYLEDIQSFEDLKKVAEDITSARASGFAALPARAWTGSSDCAGYLANLPVYFEYQEDGISTTGPSRAHIWTIARPSGIVYQQQHLRAQ
ncbi:MAG: hypothetical protein ACLRZH_18845 [Ruthenibacterium lactatiformans]